MALRERLNADLKEAMREGDTTRRDTIRLLLSALRNAEIDHRGPLPDDAEAKVVAREIKQRRDSIEEYSKGNRPDLVAREEAEMAVLSAYQPEQMSEEEIRSLVRASIERTGATGLSDLGKVMRDVMPAVQGRADGSAVNAAARAMLKPA